MIRCLRCDRRLHAEDEAHACETLEERAARLAGRARDAVEPPTRVEVGEDAWSDRPDLA